MRNDLSAHGGERRAIEIVVAEKGSMSREQRMNAGRTKEIEGQHCLRQEPIPLSEREFRMDGAEDGNEMILERPDGTFGGVSTVFFRGNSLELDLIFCEGVFEIFRTFVVENMEIRRMALAQKQLVSGLPSIADAGGLPIRNGNSVNRVSVLVVENKGIIVTATGRDVEATGLVGIRFEERLVGKDHDGNLMSAGASKGATSVSKSEAKSSEGGIKRVERIDLGRCLLIS